MRPSINSGITMPTIGTMVNLHPPSPFTGKDTRESNHGNAPSPIQTANSPNSSLNNWEITPADLPTQHLNTVFSHENAPNDSTHGLHLLYEAAMKHGKGLNKPQGYSDTNKADEPTRKTSNQAPVIFIEKKTLQHNSPPSNSEESKTYICNHRRNIAKGLHTKNKSLICCYCNKGFAQKGDLDKHLRTHTGEKPYTCEKCGKAFSQKGTLNRHLRTHTGKKPYACQNCRASFAEKSNLNKHLRTHTEDKPYTCEHCKKSFREEGTLAHHLRIHTGDKPYLCEHCGKSFTQHGTLIYHLRIHTGDKPYTCKYCKKSFAQNGTLISHLRTHTKG